MYFSQGVRLPVVIALLAVAVVLTAIGCSNKATSISAMPAAMSMPIDMGGPLDVAFVHCVPTGTEFVDTDQFFLSVLQQNGLPTGSRVAFYSESGEKEWHGDYKKRDRAISAYRSVAAQSGRKGFNITEAVDDARRWLMTRPQTEPSHRRLLILITPEKAWKGSGAEGKEFSRLLRYNWESARDGLVEVIVVGVSEEQQPKVRQAWQGRLKIAPRLNDLEHDLTYDDVGMVKPKHD